VIILCYAVLLITPNAQQPFGDIGHPSGEKGDIMTNTAQGAPAKISDDIPAAEADTFFIEMENDEPKYDKLSKTDYRIVKAVRDTRFRDVAPRGTAIRKTREIKCGYVHLNREAETVEVLREIFRVPRRRPANHCELIVFGTIYPHERKKHPIISFGAVGFSAEGVNDLVSASEEDASNCLGLVKLYNIWPADCRFLIVYE